MFQDTDEISKVETFHLDAKFKRGKGWKFSLVRGFRNREKFNYLFDKSLFFKKLDDVHIYISKELNLRPEHTHLSINCSCLGRRIQIFHNSNQRIVGTIPVGSPLTMSALDSLNFTGNGCFRTALGAGSSTFEGAYNSVKQNIRNRTKTFSEAALSIFR